MIPINFSRTKLIHIIANTKYKFLGVKNFPVINKIETKKKQLECRMKSVLEIVTEPFLCGTMIHVIWSYATIYYSS